MAIIVTLLAPLHLSSSIFHILHLHFVFHFLFLQSFSFSPNPFSFNYAVVLLTSVSSPLLSNLFPYFFHFHDLPFSSSLLFSSSFPLHLSVFFLPLEKLKVINVPTCNLSTNSAYGVANPAPIDTEDTEEPMYAVIPAGEACYVIPNEIPPTPPNMNHQLKSIQRMIMSHNQYTLK